MKGLTDKQRNILNFIEDFMDVNVMAPTVYEIAEHFNIKTSTVFAHLRSLQKKKFMTRSSKARSISLNKPKHKTRRPNGVCSIPVFENSGIKTDKSFYYDSSAMKNHFDTRKLFAVRVADSRMELTSPSGNIRPVQCSRKDSPIRGILVGVQRSL